jgi:hypothetical protein
MDLPRQHPASSLPGEASPAARLARARAILADAGIADRAALPGLADAGTTATVGAAGPAGADVDAVAPQPDDPATAPAPQPDEPDAPRAAPSTRLALAILSGAVQPLAEPARRAAVPLARRLFPPTTPGEPSRLELTALGAALVGAAFIGSTLPGASPVQAQGAAVPALFAAAPLPTTPDPTPAPATAPDAADPASDNTSDDTAAPAADATPLTDATVPTATDVPADEEGTAPDDGSDPLAGSGATTLARAALIVVHGDAPARWPKAEAGSAARNRAARGTTFAGFSTLPAAPLATGLGLIAGQFSNPATRAGCSGPEPVTPGTTDADGITVGAGCDYPAETPSIPGAIARDGRSWKAYVAAATPAEAAAKLCHPTDGAGGAAASFAQRSPLAHLADLTSSGACDAGAAPLSDLAADLKSDAPPAWVYVEVGDCGATLGACDADAANRRDSDLDAALAVLTANEPADDGRAASIVVGDGDVADLEPAPAGAFPVNPADPAAPAAVATGALLIGDDVAKDKADALVLDPLAIARTQATWLGLTPPGASAADTVSPLAVPGS